MNRETVQVTMYADTLEEIRDDRRRRPWSALQEIRDLNPRPIQPGDWITNTAALAKIVAVQNNQALGWALWPNGDIDAWTSRHVDRLRLCTPEEIPAQYPAWLDKVGVKT